MIVVVLDRGSVPNRAAGARVVNWGVALRDQPSRQGGRKPAMSRMPPVKSLTVLRCLALSGIALAPVGAHAGPPIHITPSMGHPITFDFRDQTRFPTIVGPIGTDDRTSGPSEFTGTWRIIKKPVHPNPNTSQGKWNGSRQKFP